jgi:SET domain-containing protein 6
MMYEKASGDASMWKAYFDVLPTEFDSLIWWSPQEIAELQASAVVGRIGRADADRVFRERLLPVVRAHPALFGLEDQEDKVKMEDIVLHETHVIASTIMAFAFDVEPANRDVDEDGYVTDENDADLPKGMIPLADILNADADRNNVCHHKVTFILANISARSGYSMKMTPLK